MLLSTAYYYYNTVFQRICDFEHDTPEKKTEKQTRLLAVCFKNVHICVLETADGADTWCLQVALKRVTRVKESPSE